VVEVIAALTPDQCDYVCRKSFGPLLDITVVNLETRGLLDWLLENTNPMDMIIRAGPGKNLEITKDVIHQILGLPNAGGLPEKIDWAEAVAEAAAFKSRLGLGPRSFGVDKMKQHIEKGGADSVSMRYFFLIVFNRLLFCKGSFDITNDHIYWTRQIEQFGDFDWCQLIYNDLCNAVRKWHSRDKNQVTITVYGCCLVILIYYLDHLYDKAAPTTKTDCPRIKYFDSARILKLLKADHKDGSWGNCDFRNRTETCYAQGPSIYITRLRGLLDYKIESLPDHIADRVRNILSHNDHEIARLASSLDETRRDLLRKQYQLANNVAAMIDELLRAPTQDRANPNLNAGQSSQGGVPDSNPQPIHDGQPSQSTDFFEPIVSQSVNPSCENEDFDFPDDEMLTDTQVEKLNNTFAQMEEDANANMMQSFSPAPITDMTDDAKAQETHAELSNDTNGSH